MIREINKGEEESVIEFLSKFAPEQIQFIEGDYFNHGDNIAFGFFNKRNLLVV